MNPNTAPTMTADDALGVLDRATAGIHGTRQDHIVLSQALQTVAGTIHELTHLLEKARAEITAMQTAPEPAPSEAVGLTD